MATRYKAVKPDLRRRGRYWRWGVFDYQEGCYVATYSGEFARSRARDHAKTLNSGGIAAGFTEIFRVRP
jgi:hypothetical protein